MKTLRKGFSSVENITIIILILLVLLGFGRYIKNALSGRWRSVGETMGQGRQYDPREFGVNGIMDGTLDCFFDQITNKWVDEKCYRRNNCDCTLIRGDGVELPEYEARCKQCKSACHNDQCQ